MIVRRNSLDCTWNYADSQSLRSADPQQPYKALIAILWMGVRDPLSPNPEVPTTMPEALARTIKWLPIPPSHNTFSLVSDTLIINEIYLSLQGESTFAGLPCIFIRLTACDLRCSYCDTAYAFTEGKKRTVAEIQGEVNRLAAPYIRKQQRPLVELTGGEPLLHKNLLPLIKALCDDQFTVLLETSGAHDISQVDPRVRRIMDLKCPSSGESERNNWSNLAHLKAGDEI